MSHVIIENVTRGLGIRNTNLISRFLYEQENPDDDTSLDNIPQELCPAVEGKVRVFPSAIATYYAPSDRSGLKGMFRERIRAVKSWRKGPGRYDTVFLSGNTDLEGFQGLLVARVQLFLSVVHRRYSYPCALVEWYSTIGMEPCPDTGMWMVELWNLTLMYKGIELHLLFILTLFCAA